jgi:hypothetical protein
LPGRFVDDLQIARGDIRSLRKTSRQPGRIFFPASRDDLGDKKETKANNTFANALILWRSRQDSNL